MSEDRDLAVGLLAARFARLHAAELSRRLKPLEITPAQHALLRELWREDGQTQSQLVSRLGVEQPTLAGTLKRMERAGLVVRREHPADARAAAVFATEVAQALRGEAERAATAADETVLAGLAPEERRAFVDLLRRAAAGDDDL